MNAVTGWRRWIVPAVLVVGAAAAGVLLLADDPNGTEASTVPIAISSSGPDFATADEMAAASDLVVEAVVTAVDAGRSISDPDEPLRGIRTRLATFDVRSTLVGDAPSTVVVEQEAALLDGTPIVVDGVEPIEVGDHAVWFLVADPSGETEFFAVINDQGRVPVDSAIER